MKEAYKEIFPKAIEEYGLIEPLIIPKLRVDHDKSMLLDELLDVAEKNRQNLFILHGDGGSGKSTLLRKLFLKRFL